MTIAELVLVSNQSSPTALLEAIERGYAAVAAAAAAGGSELSLGAAIGGTWLEIAELEDDTTANTICDNLWPLSGDN